MVEERLQGGGRKGCGEILQCEDPQRIELEEEVVLRA